MSLRMGSALVRVLVWGSLLPVLASCSSQHSVRALFTEKYPACLARSVEIKDLGDSRYRASGCSHEATFACDGNGCAREPKTLLELDQEKAGSPRKAKEIEDKARVAHRETQRGESSPVLDVALDEATMLRLRVSDKSSVQLRLVHIEEDPDSKDCSLDWMLNGERIKAPKAHFSRKSSLSTLKDTLSDDLVHDLGAAQQFALRACKKRWSLSPEQLEEVHHFVALYEEDRQWQDPASKATSNSMLAPADGWREWRVTDKAPEAVLEGDALNAPELFKLLSPSIFKVEALRMNGKAIGSAVAVSRTQLLTNCHVVQAAQKVLLEQNKEEYVAKLVRSDPKLDRCVLEVPDPVLTPVRGVRGYASLQIGEALFTVGTPSGLEQTLSNGLLSGLREEEGARYVQTTAPISPGSSGGGLFDAHGNLVGITTLVLVGRERINQSLNFAVPADSFWAP